LGGDHPGRTISPVGAAIPECNSAELQTVDSGCSFRRLSSHGSKEAPEITEVVPELSQVSGITVDKSSRQHEMVSEAKATKCNTCCAGFLSLHVAQWLFCNGEGKQDSGNS